MAETPEKIFDRMQMMARYFRENAGNPSYLPEAKASALINGVLKNGVLNSMDLERIKEIQPEVDNADHKDDVHWYDYKLHLNAWLFLKGYSGTVF